MYTLILELILMLVEFLESWDFFPFVFEPKPMTLNNNGLYPTSTFNVFFVLINGSFVTLRVFWQNNRI